MYRLGLLEIGYQLAHSLTKRAVLATNKKSSFSYKFKYLVEEPPSNLKFVFQKDLIKQ